MPGSPEKVSKKQQKYRIYAKRKRKNNCLVPAKYIRGKNYLKKERS